MNEILIRKTLEHLNIFDLIEWSEKNLPNYFQIFSESQNPFGDFIKELEKSPEAQESFIATFVKN